MAVNQNPYLAFERDLTPEQLAEMTALTKRWTEPTSQTRWNEGGEYTISNPGFYGGKLSDDKFSPYLNWIPNYIGTGSGENFSTEIDPSGAGYWGPISQPANISTWGRSDRTGTWDPNTGKWLGYQTESTGLRDFANFVGTAAAMYFGGQALAGAGGGGAAAGGAGAAAGGTGGMTAAEQAAMMAANGMSDAEIIAALGAEGATSAGLMGVGGGAAAGGTTLTPWYADPAVQRAAIGAGTTLLSNSIGGGGGADPSQVNPAQLAQITQANNQNTWQQQLNASRVNSVTPEGSSTWSQTPQFNQGAYDQAMQAWQAAGNPNLPQPTREQFTTQQWTNTQTLNPQNQALRDAQRGFQQDAANALPGAAQRYLSGAAQGPNRSGIPDFQYTASTQQQGQLGANARPTYGQVSAPGSMSNPTFGNINRGGLTSSAQTTARDWASTVQGDVTDWNRQLAALDPWMFDQQGSDAMYNMSTRYMLPQQQAEKQALEARLGEQGFVPGTPAYETALKQILDSQSLAQADARDRALLAGREFGNQAFDNKAGALSSAVSGMLNFGDLGIRTDANAFNQNLSNAQLANAAQQQDFAQQLALSQQDFQEGLAANDVVKQLFGMNLDATNTNNRWAGQGFQDLLGLTQTNNAAIGANNNIALQLAQLNNAAVGQARNQANTDFNTDFNANRTAALDLYGAANQPIPQAPGALTSVVPGMNTADIAGMLQQYFGNNVDLQNASTAERNAIINALGQFLSAVVTGG